MITIDFPIEVSLGVIIYALLSKKTSDFGAGLATMAWLTYIATIMGEF